jgi:hypothetical protein
MYLGRDRADVLLHVAARLGGKVRQALPEDSFQDYLRRRLRAVTEDVDSLWSGLVESGVWSEERSGAGPPAANLVAVTHAPAQPLSAGSEYLFHLLPFASTSLGTGREANIPWLQELPDPMTSVVWGSWVEINPRTALELGIRQNEWVWLESQSGRIKVPALIHPAARPDTLSLPFGQGHSSYGRYASGRGVNPWEVLSPLRVRGTGEPAWAATRVNIRKTGEQAQLTRLGNDLERVAARGE